MTLSAAPPATQKHMLGGRVLPLVSAMQPTLAGKITGLMLEMDNVDILDLIASEERMRNQVADIMRRNGSCLDSCPLACRASSKTLNTRPHS